MLALLLAADMGTRLAVLAAEEVGERLRLALGLVKVSYHIDIVIVLRFKPL